MSLIAWYKLDILNDSIGSNNLNYINNSGGLTIYNYSKMGKSSYRRLTLNNGTDLLRSINKIHLVGDFTMSCWAYVEDCHINTANGLVTNHSHIDNSGAGITIKYISATDFRISCNTGDGTTRTFHTYYGTTNIKSIWAHLLLKFEKNTNRLSLWVNGIEEFNTTYNMYCISDYIDIFNWSTTNYTSNNYRPACIIDDVRIYNHVLSDREILKLSKGLLCQYLYEDNLNDSTFNGLTTTSANITYDINKKLGFKSGYFAGTNDYEIVNPNYPYTFSDPFTISSWIYVPTSATWSNGFYSTIISRGSYGGFHGICRSFSDNTIAVCLRGATLYNPTYVITRDIWYHVVMVNTGSQVQLYVNGVLRSFANHTEQAYVAGSTNYYVGTPRAYSGNVGGYYTGYLDDTRIYSTALSSTDILELYQTRHSLDYNGNYHTPILNEIGFNKMNLDYTIWQNGQTGSIGMFTQNGQTSENSRVLGNDPFGKETVLWQSVSDVASDADGGWNSTLFNIDKTKMYRFSVWVKRNLSGNGSFYLGSSGYNASSVNTGLLNKSTGVVSTNPYFHISSSTGLNEWILVVGHIWSDGTSIGANHIDSGLYNISGKIGSLSIGDYIWNTDSAKSQQRTYLFYCTDINVNMWFVYPRIDLINGDEPNIIELLNGFDSNNIDYIRSIGNRNLSLDSTNSMSNVSEINEIGITNGLVAYYPLDKDVKDYSINNYHGTLTGAILAKGIIGNCYQFSSISTYIDLPNYIGYTTEVSAFTWFKRVGVPGTGYHIICGGQEFEISVVESTGQLRVGIYTNARFVANYSSGLTDNNWHHIGFTFNGTTKIAYIDGIDVGNQAVTGTLTNSFSNRRIGRFGSSIDYYPNGLIDDFRVYNKVLTAAEINILYDLGKMNSKMKLTENKTFLTGEVIEAF